MSYKNYIHLSLLILSIPLFAARAWPQDIPLGADGKRTITAVQTDTSLKIDGFLNEPAWKNAQFQGQFTQREPDEGEPASEKTEIGFLYNKTYLYIGIKCFDSEPDKIIAREMRRDALVDDDDYFEMVLDTYHDHRSAYYFITNPHGVKRESLMANEGRDYNPAWDGVWWCKAKMTREGWFIEIVSPGKH